jgi:Ger(x)C family germination protein
MLDAAIVMITAVDEGRKPGTFRTHAHIVVPMLIPPGMPVQGRAAKPITHVVTEGKNIDEARFKADQMLPRDVVTSHRRVFLIGESLARKGIREILDQISRNPQNRLSAFIVISENIKAAELIDAPFTLEAFGGEVIRRLVMRKAGVPTSLKDYFLASTTPGQQPIAASFALKEQKITFSGIAVFTDSKLTGFVKGIEATVLNSLLGGKPQMSMSVPIRVPGSKGDLSVQMNKLQAHGRVDIRKGKPLFTFRLKGGGRIMDNRSNLDLSDPAKVDKVNKLFAAKLERSCDSLFHLLQQKYKADSVGLGAMIYRKNPGYWKRIEKQWPELYTKQKVVCKVQTEITSVGAIGAPLYIPEKGVKK